VGVDTKTRRPIALRIQYNLSCTAASPPPRVLLLLASDSEEEQDLLLLLFLLKDAVDTKAVVRLDDTAAKPKPDRDYSAGRSARARRPHRPSPGRVAAEALAIPTRGGAAQGAAVHLLDGAAAEASAVPFAVARRAVPCSHLLDGAAVATEDLALPLAVRPRIVVLLPP
jgi:hypothetical protein